MHFSTALLAVVACLGGLGSAAPAPVPALGRPQPPPSPTSSRCYTRMATAQGLWNTQTSWGTHYTPCTSTVTATKTATSTSTPAPSTSTITATSTLTVTGDTSTLTDTETSTTTITESTTTTLTTVSTTETTTTETSTSTVAAPAGFIPIQTSLPGSTCDDNCGPKPVGASASKRGLAARNAPAAGGLFAAKGPGKSPWKYPQGVQCVTYKPQCSTKTVTSTTTSVVTATQQTTTTTSTSTVTVTTIPSATATVTSTASVTTTTTLSTTTTSTTTSTATTAVATSIYAACATNNLADLYAGQGFVAASGGSYDTVDTVAADNAYDCCVAAITDPNGQAVAFGYIYSASSCQIALQNGGEICSQPSSQFSLLLGPETAVFGNGLCGETTSAFS